MAIEKIEIEVAYAVPQKQYIVSLKIPRGTTIGEAIDLSGILNIFPEIDLTKQKVGVFSKLKKLSDFLRPHDRIEIYRSLIIEPKTARKVRAQSSHFKIL